MKFDSIQQIADKFDEMVPSIAENYEKVVTKILEELLEKYEGNMSGVANQWGQDGAMWRQFRNYADYVKPNGEPTDGVVSFGDVTIVDYEKIKKGADKYAQFEVDRFKHKLVKKLKDLENLSNLKVNGLEFSFNGTVGDHSVFVEQTTIIKFSVKNKIFNQWPCRIYVDGKMMPESKFKKLQEEYNVKEAV
jgi:hypothetical protein